MYENGKRLNKYARKQIHQRLMKRRATPLEYASYNVYADHEDRDDLLNGGFYQSRIQNGWKPYHRRWWNTINHPTKFIHKKFLKEDAHQKERAHYKEQLAHYDIEEDAMRIQKKFSDPWCWD